MKLVNCTVCGELFRSRDGEICDICTAAKDDNPLKKVRDFITSSNRKVSLVDVSQATGVDKKLILKYIRDNRVTIVKESWTDSLDNK
ncbi:hypothetical protein F8154_00455 [Alkaliphilus pronyensis]|uniref:Flagellar protein n=1 Tax=Alkaliphilus pronyensis TaxID=1482732 RepID=A0A6I0FML8_9FIRM|nr:hypothetical protein [Alkaliphilus pronyensis]KAB3539658.1 hypothetical protein F8154_00455 [Alkaliphilus pronyensis]